MEELHSTSGVSSPRGQPDEPLSSRRSFLPQINNPKLKIANLRENNMKSPNQNQRPSLASITEVKSHEDEYAKSLKKLAKVWRAGLISSIDRNSEDSAHTYLTFIVDKVVPLSEQSYFTFSLLNIALDLPCKCSSNRPKFCVPLQNALIQQGFVYILFKYIAKNPHGWKNSLSITIMTQLLRGPNLSAQKRLLASLKQSNRRRLFLLSLARILRSEDHHHLPNLKNPGQSIEQKMTVLKLLHLMCQNCYTPMSAFLFSQGYHGLHSINLPQQVGDLFLRLSWDKPFKYQALLNQVLLTLIEFSHGGYLPLKEYFSRQRAFVTQLQNLIFSSYKYALDIQEGEGFSIFCNSCKLLVSISYLDHRQSPLFSIELVLSLNIRKLKQLLTSIYQSCIQNETIQDYTTQQKEHLLNGAFSLFTMLVAFKKSLPPIKVLATFGILMPFDERSLQFLASQQNETLRHTIRVQPRQNNAAQHGDQDSDDSNDEASINFCKKYLTSEWRNTLLISSAQARRTFKNQKIQKKKCCWCCKRSTQCCKKGKKQDHDGQRQSRKRERFLKAFLFYSSNCATVEVLHHQQLERVIFKTPSYCQYLTKLTRDEIVLRAGLLTSSEKNQLLIKSLSSLKVEMKRQEYLLFHRKCCYSITRYWNQWAVVHFMAVVVINLVLLFSTHDLQDIGFGHSPSLKGAFWFLKVLQLFLIILSTGSYLYQTYPVLLMKHATHPETERQTLDRLFPRVNRSRIELVTNEREASYANKQGKCKVFRILKERKANWNLILCLLSIIAFLGLPHIFYPLMLLDIVARLRTLGHVVRAIQSNWQTLVSTLLLLLVISYIYAIISFSFFQNDFAEENSGNFFMYCNNLFECFASVLNGGLRSGGGLGQNLEQPSINSPHFWQRYIFDLSFYLVVIIVMLNIIFGVLLDAFADLRDRDKALQQDIQNKCLVCGLEKKNFETMGKDWEKHIREDHNVWSYVYFMLSIQDKPQQQCSALEKFVKVQIEQSKTGFFPSGQALVFQIKAQINEAAY